MVWWDVSADGKVLAFTRSVKYVNEIALVGLDGGVPRTLEREAMWPRWSPDGKMIAYLTGIGSKKSGGPLSVWVQLVGVQKP